MDDRRAGGGEGSLACPFLALAGDRDTRGDAPDRRHRCYAESEPAPRAIAHQEHYCLSSGFIGCPTFADWVRREGARVIPSAGAPRHGDAWREAARPAGEAWPAPDADRDREATMPAATGRPDGLDAPARDPARARGDGDRAPADPGLWEDERAWAAPPPWLRDDGAGDGRAEPTGAAEAPRAGADDDLEAYARRTRPAMPRPVEPDWGQAALRGEPVEPVADESAEALPTSTRRPFDEAWDPAAQEAVVAASAGAIDAVASRAAGPAGVGDPGASDDLPGFLAGRRRVDGGTDGRLAADEMRTSRDVVASYTNAHVRGAPVEHRAPVGAGPSRPSVDYRPDGTPRPGRAMPAGSVGATRPAGSPRPSGRDMPGPVGGEISESRGDRGVPPWEQGQRREFYPDLRPRMGMPRLPRLWIGLLALILAGIVLFLLPTVLPGLFTGGPSATRTPVTSAAPSVSVAPTPTPAPTAQVYTVAEGDTLSGIAARFGLTVTQLEKANPQLKDPNKLAIGDQLTIPAHGGAAQSAGSESAAP